MGRQFDHRAGHYLLLIAVWALTCLPNLGAPGLWDIDEGNNATCAFEMLESGNWIVPTFNYRLREDKPALLYWLQMACFATLGVNETAARFPSALAALFTVVVVYELGRRMFGLRTGLWAGLILGGSVGLLGAAHFANPDALLVACTSLTLACVWRDEETPRRGWLVGVGIACGLAVLAKGPIGVLAPTGICVVYFAWQRKLTRLLDWRLGDVVLALFLVAAPWYVWVTVETRGAWIAGFWNKHHAERAMRAMENHSGPVYYYAVVLLVGLMPWSIFFGPTVSHTWQRLRDAGAPDRPAVRFLVAWAMAFLVFFTVVQTKLPNYILPAYPALALLMAHMLERWRRGEWEMPAWVVRTSLVCLALIGVGLGVAMLIGGGKIPLPPLRGRAYPELANSAWLGLIFVAGAALAGWLLARGRRSALLATVAAVGVAFAALLAGFGLGAIEPHKATRPLAAAIPPGHHQREVRIAAYRYFQPSLVFYCRREIVRLDHADQVRLFLTGPLEAYLFVPEGVWQNELHAILPAGVQVFATQDDLYTGKRVVLIGNRRTHPPGRVSEEGKVALNE